MILRFYKQLPRQNILSQIDRFTLLPRQYGAEERSFAFVICDCFVLYLSGLTGIVIGTEEVKKKNNVETAK